MSSDLSRRGAVALAAAAQAKEIGPEEVDEFARAVDAAEAINDLDPRWRELIERFAPEE